MLVYVSWAHGWARTAFPIRRIIALFGFALHHLRNVEGKFVLPPRGHLIRYLRVEAHSLFYIPIWWVRTTPYDTQTR